MWLPGLPGRGSGELVRVESAQRLCLRTKHMLSPLWNSDPSPWKWVHRPWAPSAPQPAKLTKITADGPGSDPVCEGAAEHVQGAVGSDHCGRGPGCKPQVSTESILQMRKPSRRKVRELTP